jgi:hypothetical protein
VSDDNDEMIERLAARLRPLPEVDPAARARVLVAVAAERERDREQRRRLARRPRVLRWSVAGLAAAALLGALVIRQQRVVARASVAPLAAAVAPAARVSTAAAALTADDRSAVALQPVQLVFRAPDARRVSVVGDFSGWDPGKAVMTRDSASGLWSVKLSLAPGRHVYAFLVDDTVWVRDPRAPAAPDVDFGRPGSVLLVGRP